MTFDATPRRPAQRPWTAWIAGAAAVLALGVLLWAALGGQRREAETGSQTTGPRRAATVGAVEAVALSPDLDPGPAGRLGGAGSVVVDGPPLPVAGEGSAQAGQRRAPRSRPRSEPRREPRSDQPSYRVIGPTADSAPAASAPAGA